MSSIQGSSSQFSGLTNAKRNVTFQHPHTTIKFSTIARMAFQAGAKPQEAKKLAWSLAPQVKQANVQLQNQKITQKYLRTLGIG